MAEYDYHCNNCGDMTLNLKLKDIPLEKCPKCDRKSIKRVFNKGLIDIWKCGGAFGRNN